MSTDFGVPPSHPVSVETAPGTTSRARRLVRTVRAGWTGLLGGVLGLLPHVLHHVSPLAGTALVAGSGGTLLFGVVGLVASVPMLLRLHRRFGTWWAPAIGLLAFAAMFALSTFVIGPQISGQADVPDTPVEQHSDHLG